jgi:fatty acid desaturase
MTDGVRTALNWIAAVGGAFGLLTALAAFVVSLRKKHVQETTAPRTLAIAIMLLAIAAVAWGTAAIWPMPPE